MSNQLRGVILSQIDTNPLFVLGQLHVDNLGNHYRYLQADGAVVAKNLYSYIANTWQVDAPIDLTVTPATGESVPACVFDGSSVDLTDNQYAWFFVGPGIFTTITAGDVAADAIVYGHATAGVVDDTASACLLPGVSAITAITGAVAGTFYAAHPLYATDLA